jgi:predicted transposase/invertase (TIGR01784 family)
MANTSNNSELTKPHDLLVKATLANPQALKDFASIHLPQPVLAQMDLDSLQLTNKSYVSADMKEFHNDIVFSFSLQSHPGYAFCMIEHQSTPDRMLPLRFLQYQVNLIRVLPKLKIIPL